MKDIGRFSKSPEWMNCDIYFTPQLFRVNKVKRGRYGLREGDIDWGKEIWIGGGRYGIRYPSHAF